VDFVNGQHYYHIGINPRTIDNEGRSSPLKTLRFLDKVALMLEEDGKAYVKGLALCNPWVNPNEL
jgi:hypothetical protein